MKQIKRLIGILQFMTRFPIPLDVGIDDEFYKGMLYFPIVGFILGLFYYLAGFLGMVWFNNNHYLSAIIILITEAILTGGLHLDGLGDAFDGLYSYRSKERILEIMKDSRLGTNGLLAIVFLILFKVGTLYALLEKNMLWCVIIMPIYARTMQAAACYKTVTPRTHGMGNIFIGKITKSRLAAVILLTLGISSIITYAAAGSNLKVYGFMGASLIIMLILVRLYITNVYKKIEGITGDILGCICELSELIFLILIYKSL